MKMFSYGLQGISLRPSVGRYIRCLAGTIESLFEQGSRSMLPRKLPTIGVTNFCGVFQSTEVESLIWPAIWSSPTAIYRLMDRTAYFKEYYDKNREKISEKQRLYRLEHPERRLKAQRKWAANNREKVNDLARDWRAKNPDRVKESVNRCYRKKCRQEKSLPRQKQDCSSKL